MSDASDLINSLIELISKKDSLLQACSLVLPGGLIYIFFRNEFTDSPMWFIIIYSLMLIIIYWFFLYFKKGLKLKFFGIIEYLLLNLNIKKDFEDFKKYCSDLSYEFKTRKISHKKTEIKTFNKWIEDSDKWTEDFVKRTAVRLDSYKSDYDIIILDFETLKDKARTAQEDIKNTNITIPYINFLIIIFISFILSMVIYHFEFVKTMNQFQIVYVLIFIILLLIAYLNQVLRIILSIFYILFGKLILSISKIFLNWRSRKFSHE